ncbi:MAG TPA: RNA methyltransferase substrate-binding domain-containing protein, partial [Saprospiraceae bacterium]|nr:RNA methyltransferase substrate-binding domain-containing protein [Saprospiraceae bacterium]
MGNDTSCIYGRHPVTEAIRSGQTIDKVLLQQGTRGEFEKEIRHLCKAAGIPMQVVPREKLSQLVSGNHQGVIALVSLGTYYALEDLLPN